MASPDAIAQLEAAVAQRAADRYADIALWQGIAGALREIREGVIAQGRPILSVEEACQLVNVGSRAAFHRWCATWKVRASGHGRYPRRALLAGLEREANAVIPRRRTPERPASPPPAEQLAA